MSKYFIPINTDINLNEEFRLRLYNFYTRINGLSYYLPNTYFVDTTNGNLAYSTYTSVLDVNPKVYDSNNNLVTGALTRSNGNWILNLNTTGTYTLYAYYCRQSKTLKPTGADDFDPDTNHENLAWQVTLEVYNPSVRKVLNTTLYAYNQQGYNWLRYNNPDWELVDTLTSPQNVLSVSQTGSSDAKTWTIPFTYLNNVTWTTIGIDLHSLRGVNKQRSVKLHANLQFRKIWSEQQTEKICFSSEDLTGSTDSSLGTDVSVGQELTMNIDLPLNTVDSPFRGTVLWIWNNGQWESACSIHLNDNSLELNRSNTDMGLQRIPYIKTNSQIWYY